MRFRESYTPKPLDPGQPFTALGLYGVVWSAGPEANSLWIKTDAGDVVCVKTNPQGVPSRRLPEWDSWRERMAEVARSPWLDQQYRRVK